MEHTDNEQLDALKAWWQKNGKIAVTVAIIALAVFVATRLWMDYQNKQADAASLQYDKLMVAVEEENPGLAEQIANTLVSQYQSTPYGPLGALMLARIKLMQNDTMAARIHLQWVLDNAGEEEIRQIARLRLARVLLSNDDAAGAMLLLEGHSGGAYQAAYDELLGDIYLAQGKTDEARAAYGRALALGQTGAGDNRLLQMKLDDLAPASGGEAQ